MKGKERFLIQLCLGCLILFIGGSFAFGEPSPSKRELSKVKTIILDPGHGGKNEGCIGPSNIREKVVTLQVALELEKALLEKTNAKVILTRRDDVYVGLRERTRFANEQKGDIFISIHMNASPTGSGVGIETFLLSNKSSSEEIQALVDREQEDLPISATTEEVRAEEIDTLIYDMKLRAAHSLSERLAAKIQRSLIRKTAATDRGVKQAPFAVLKEAEMPAVVLECGFLTHPKEEQKLLEPKYQKTLASGIVRAIIEFDKSLETD